MKISFFLTMVFFVILLLPPVFGNNKTPENMIFVEGGTFRMGDVSGEGESDERPVRSVSVNDFLIGKYEVTQAEWKELMAVNPSNFKGSNLPVENVDWYECIEYCNVKSKKEGLTPYYNIDKSKKDPTVYHSKWLITENTQSDGYRLPTEAEWEYAARGGFKTQQTKYAGSNNLNEVAVYRLNANSSPKPVGSKRPNELGIYDMTGNVWEWCFDWYNVYPGNQDPNDNCGTKYRVLRGGSWNNNNNTCRMSFRNIAYPHYRVILYGFRIARNL